MNENFDSIPSKADTQYEGSLRPSHWDGYIGQEQIKKNLKVFVTAANKRNEALDHTLLFGPPGLGKTTLAHIIATEMNTSIKVTAAPMIEKAGDLAAMLTNLEAGDILFIDEIHRLSPAVEEILYPAMEDYRLDIIIGSGPTAQSVNIELPHFTIIGATTRAGMISNPLRDRFGMHFRLQFYKQEELAHIIQIAAKKLDKPGSADAAMEMARRSRGTPRIALRLLRRVRDFAEVEDETNINLSRTQFALSELGINDYGFDEQDIKLLTLLMDNKGKAMGLSTIAAAMSEDEGTIEDVIEPYLLANSYIERTPRGRKATSKSYELFKISERQTLDEGLFNEI